MAKPKTKSKLPPSKPKFGGGKPKAFSKPPDKKANEEYGMPLRKRTSEATADFDRSQGNVETGFRQNTVAKATAAGPAMKVPKTPGQFKPMAAAGNNDFGYIGASKPAPMKPGKSKKKWGI